MNKTPTSNGRKTPSPDLSESPSVSVNLLVSEDGHLDVSDNGLTRISDRQMKNLQNLTSVVSLNASRNKFTVIDFLKLIPNCRCVDASDNQIKRLLTFVPLKKTLEVLDVSYNQISATEHFLSQLPQLRVLSIHHNSLTSFPSIDELVNLTSLDLSYNHLSNFPNVKRVPNLIFLAVNGNKISTLKDIPNFLPVHLSRLELSENLIADLTEINFLKALPNLEDFSFASNPAVLPPNNKFNYRPYIVSKQLNLKMINDLEVSDEERLVAEHLHINKKISPLGPGEGNHTVLVKLLEIESPLDHPLDTLTPTHPSLTAVRQDYLHNKSATGSVFSTPRVSRTPDANIRRISPRRSATFDESSMILKPLNLPPRRRLRSIDRISSGSEDTVVLSTSISEAMNLDCPRIDSTDESARTKSMPDLPGNEIDINFRSSSKNSHVHFEQSPRSARVNTNVKPSPRNAHNNLESSPRSARTTTNIKPSPRSARTTATTNARPSPRSARINPTFELNYISNQHDVQYDSILPPIVSSYTNIIKESPFHSIVDEIAMSGNTVSSENSENLVNRTLTIVPNLSGSIETPEASREIYHFNDPMDVRLMKLENRIQKLELEKDPDVTVMMNSLVETTRRLTDLMVDVNTMAKSVIGITNNLTNFLMTKSTTNVPQHGTPNSEVNFQQDLQKLNFISSQVGTLKKEDKITNGNGINYLKEKN